MDRTAQRKPIERRPAVANTLQRSAAAPARPAALGLQERIGNRATQALVARSIAIRENTPPREAQLSSAKRLPSKISKPNDPAELEAEETARKVLRMREPGKGNPPPAAPKSAKGTVQRSEAAPAAAVRPASASPYFSGGAPLPSPVRTFMEPRFGANFSNVRIHTGPAATQQSAALNANAFTVGEHIVFGKDKFQPQTEGGRELIAHELTHTIQQGAVVQRDVAQRNEDVRVSEHTGLALQGGWFGIPNPRQWFADRAAAIPGFTMLTVIIGKNPITGNAVERNAGNILRGAIDMIPGGSNISEALANHGIFDKVSQWASQQFEALRSIGDSIWNAIKKFIDDFSLSDLTDPSGLWERAKSIVTDPINQIKRFVGNLVSGIITLIKDAILRPIAQLASGTRGYPLLCTILGNDPITGEAVPRSPANLLGGFLKFIGQEEVWNRIQSSNAIPRAMAWFDGALAGLLGFIREIPSLFVRAFRALEILDIILVPRALAKLWNVFGDFAGRFISWGADKVWTLLEIVFDVISPGAFAYVKRTGSALRSILRNPLPFVGNLVRAAKLGFTNFASNFLGHLKAGLIDWLTGSLPGIYIPKALSLVEIVKFVMSVLGLTWANIRQKLVKATSETAVKAMETGFALVTKLVTEGPAAAWEQIKEQLSNLKEMAIGAITDFVVDMVVKKAVPRLISMFIPGAGFLTAILSIYDTVMVFVNKISQIIQVVTGFIDSIVQIAAGNIGAAATRVESALANVLSLAINFLAGFAGLGKVADTIMGVVGKIRAPIDKALDWLVGWIVKAAKGLAKKIVQAGVPQDPAERLRLGTEAAIRAARALGNRITQPLLTPIFAGIKLRYGLSLLEAFVRGGTWWARAAASPPIEVSIGISVATGQASGQRPSQLIGKNTPNLDQLEGQEPGVSARYVVGFGRYTGEKYTEIVTYVEHRAARKLGRVREAPGLTAYAASGGATAARNNRSIQFLVPEGSGYRVERERIPDMFVPGVAVGDVKDVATQSFDAQMRDNDRIRRAENVRVRGEQSLLASASKFDLVVRAPSADGDDRTHVSGPLQAAVRASGGKVYELL